MSSPFKSPEFRALFRDWNRKLERDGHEEIEDFTRPVPTLKTWTTTRWTASDPTRNEWRQQYYEMADRVLETFAFANRVHRRIWELHCEGLSIREIADRIRRRNYRKTAVAMVILTIQKTSGLKNG